VGGTLLPAVSFHDKSGARRGVLAGMFVKDGAETCRDWDFYPAAVPIVVREQHRIEEKKIESSGGREIESEGEARTRLVNQ